MSIQHALANLENTVKDTKGVYLEMSGRLLCRISRTTPLPKCLSSKLSAPCGTESLKFDDTFLRDMTLCFRDWLSTIKTVHVDSQVARKVFYDTLTWDMNTEVTSTSLERFTKWCTLLDSLTCDAGQVSDLELEALRAVNERHYHVQLCGYERYRRLFVTDNGKVGKAIYAVEDGDLIVLPCWSRMPAVLRPIENGEVDRGSGNRGSDKMYLLVGFAYIEGLMDCNEWGLQEEELEVFCLI
jgi:hypothetical protein